MTESELVQDCIKSQRELKQKLIEEQRERISRGEELDFVCFELYKQLQEENARLNEQVNTYLEMLANETKKRIPDSKGSTVWEKSLTEKLAKAKELLRKFFEAKSIEETCVAESEAESFLKELDNGNNGIA